MKIELAGEPAIISVREVDLTDKQRELLRQIYQLAREMETINNQGTAHCLIALIEELSNGSIAISYLQEKLTGLFRGV